MCPRYGDDIRLITFITDPGPPSVPMIGETPALSPLE